MLLLVPPLSRSLRRCCFRLPLLSSFFRSSPQFFWDHDFLGHHGRSKAVRYPGTKFKFSSLAEFSEYECDESCDDTKATEKDNALRQAIYRLAGDFGRESMLSLQRFFGSRHAPVISTGSLRLDLALGIGGLPKGRIVEIYGREASGKTTLALHIIKEAQRLGGFCAYFDVENAMDTSLAESMGLNTKNLLISRPDSAENLLSVVNTLAKCGSVDVIVIDSVAALVPQCELDGTIGDFTKDVKSRLMTQALRKIHHSLSQSQALVVFLNQVRLNAKPGKSFGCVDEVTCGGNALRFYAAVRLRLIRTRLLKNINNEVTGLGICVQVVKNKLTPTLKKVDLEMQFGKGLCSGAEILDLACDHGVIFQEGSNYLIEGKDFCSKHEAERYLMQNDDIFYNVVMLLRNRLFDGDS